MTKTELITKLESALQTFIADDRIPDAINLGHGKSVEFVEEPVDDDFLGCKCLRNPSGLGLQVHELEDGKSIWQGINDDYVQGGWLILDGQTASDIAEEIISDFSNPYIYAS